ncbi:MAG: hypothetical protein V3V15_10055 [Sphingorhabdus sp.]
MSAAFSPAMQAALTRYDIPALPTGFADRLVARAAAEAALEPAAKLRRRSGSPWKRTSRIIGSVAAIGFFSATAAAMGLFGDPIEIPIFSDVARQLELVDRPRAVPRAIAATPKLAPAALADETAADKAKAASAPARQALAAIVNDPHFAKLSPMQKRAQVKRAARRLVQSGDATRGEVRAALRDIRSARRANDRRPSADAAKRRAALKQRLRNATPEQKARLREKFKALPPEKQKAIRDRLAAASDQSDKPQRAETAVTSLSETPVTEIAAAETAKAEAAPVVIAPITAAPPRPQQAEKARERYRRATPKQRAKARDRIRRRRGDAARSRAKRPSSVRARRAQVRRRRN